MPSENDDESSGGELAMSSRSLSDEFILSDDVESIIEFGEATLSFVSESQTTDSSIQNISASEFSRRYEKCKTQIEEAVSEGLKFHIRNTPGF